MTTTKNDASTGEVVHEDLVTVTIDDVEVQVPKGTLVIRAAELIGTAIPRFCDHPLLDPVAACRQCLVEITDAGNGRGMPKPQPSCAIEVADNMVVKTQLTSPVADKAQHGQMEFLLVNHPLDCPICDKGGECPLQNQAMSNGRGDSRFEGVKRTYPKPINISAQVLLDRDRCILCARCTRFSEQIAGDPFIELVERGALQQVGYYAKQPFESYFSGNTIQICPVGALTSSAYRFRSRPFDLVSTPSIAEIDAGGSAIRVDHRRGEVMRRMAGDDPAVNEEWISDKDRFAFRSGRLDDRVTTPLVRDDDGSFRAASWPEALDVAATGLREARGRAGVLTGGRVTLENAYAYSKFARTVLGTNDIDFRARPHSAEETEFLAHAVAGRGVAAGRGLDDAAPVTYSGLEDASTVLLVALEPEEECPTLFLRLRKAYRKHTLPVWTVAGYLSNGARKMGAGLVPCLPGAEAATVAALPREVQLDERSVILVGERAALSAGTLTEVLTLAHRTGARLAWVPRRAGDRGAVEAGCLPNLLPGARPVTDAVARVDAQAAWGVDGLPDQPGLDADALLRAASAGEVGGLVVGGVEPADCADPRAVLDGVENAGFVVSLEQRFTAVTERADVVFPICLNEERSGTYWNWEGRDRPFPTVIRRDNAMDDVRVLAALADALGAPLGFRTAADARAELTEVGVWDGDRAPAPTTTPGRPAEASGDDEVVLGSWRMLLDDSRCADNEPALQATARRPIARINPRTAAAVGIRGEAHRLEPTAWMSVTTGGGQSTVWPVEMVDDMVLGAVWVPSRPRHHDRVAARPGEIVTIAPAAAPAPAGHGEQDALRQNGESR